MHRVHVDGGPTLTLTPAQFVGRGGQGTVYAVGDTAVKLFTEAPGPPEARLRAAAALRDPRVIAPRHLVRDDAGGVIGYTMRRVEDPHPWAALAPQAFQDRHGLGPTEVMALVLSLRDAVAAVHAQGWTIVDLSDRNVLVGTGFDEVALIDVDSWAGAGFPATAITDAVRDRRATSGVFDAGTDWFAFAVISFAVLIGVHPYRGRHPAVHGLDARMDAGISVFDPAVVLPGVCRSLHTLPDDWRHWYQAVFQHDLRVRPPGSARLPTLVATPVHLASQAMIVTEILRLAHPILAAGERGGPITAVTSEGVWVDGRRWWDTPPGTEAGLAWPAGSDLPVLVQRAGSRLSLFDVRSGRSLATDVSVHALSCHRGRVVVRSADRLVELELHRMGDDVVAAPRQVGQVLAHATRMLRGVAVQDLLGVTWLHLFPPGRGAPQVRVPELDGRTVLDAELDGTVLAAVVTRTDGGQDRLLFRFAASFSSYDVQVTEDVALIAPSVACLDTGVAVVLEPDESWLVLPAAPHRPGARTVRDPLLAGDMTLVPYRGRVAVVRGGVLATVSLGSPCPSGSSTASTAPARPSSGTTGRR